MKELKEREQDLDTKIKLIDKERRDLERAFTRKDKSVGALQEREEPNLRHGFKSQASLGDARKLHFKDNLENHSSSDSTAEDQALPEQTRQAIRVVSALNTDFFDSAASSCEQPVKNAFGKTSHSQKPFPRQYHPHI